MSSKSLSDIKRELIQEVALVLRKDIETISLDEPFHDMGLDSLSFVELLVFIEKKFNLTLIDTTLSKEDFSTINTLSQRLLEAIND